MSHWWPCGEDHAQHKLSQAEVIEIRELAREGSWSFREIGEMFGVSKATVSDIKHGRAWAHLWNDATTENEIAASSTATE
jgi:IS30 family transposase